MLAPVCSKPSKYLNFCRVNLHFTISFKQEIAELRHWHGVCLTIRMLKRIGRLFVIKTRTEAWLVTYAIALGAVERGQHYLQTYPGVGGYLLALASTGVVFVAGAKLLDSVRPKPAIAIGPFASAVVRRRGPIGNRPTNYRSRRGLESRREFRKGSRQAKLPSAHSAVLPEDQTRNPHS